MRMRVVWHIGLALFLTLVASSDAADARKVTGTYRNYALGYSVEVPKGSEGVTGDEDGPERGFRIPLRSGGIIYVHGEPNSLEWKSAREGVQWFLTLYKCDSKQQELSDVLIGPVRGVKGTSVCGDRLIAVFLAFRPNGGPIYWLTLETAKNQTDDTLLLERVAASFKIIAWK